MGVFERDVVVEDLTDVPVAETTFGKYEGATRRNYSSLPTRNVRILHGFTCAHEDCEEPDVVFIAAGWAPPRDGMPDVYRHERWVHVEAGRFDHEATPQAKCSYCGAGPEHLTSSQHAWHDQTECSRCGGVSGYAIGD